MEKLNTTKKAYYEILKLVNKHKELINFDISDLEYKSKLHLFGIELKEVYGFNIDPKYIRSLECVDLSQHAKIYLMGEKHGRTISWPDNGEQPNGELLLVIQFPTGAYIFGQDYPKELFQKFFRELIDLKPKYTDIHNSCLYFPMEIAGNVYNQFNEIYKKYHDINQVDYKQRKIQKMKDELAKLENSK